MTDMETAIAWCRAEQKKADMTVMMIDRGELRVFRNLHGNSQEDWTTEYAMTQRALSAKMNELADAYEALRA